jgi:hypothetical protein
MCNHALMFDWQDLRLFLKLLLILPHSGSLSAAALESALRLRLGIRARWTEGPCDPIYMARYMARCRPAEESQIAAQ